MLRVNAPCNTSRMPPKSPSPRATTVPFRASPNTAIATAAPLKVSPAFWPILARAEIKSSLWRMAMRFARPSRKLSKNGVARLRLATFWRSEMEASKPPRVLDCSLALAP